SVRGTIFYSPRAESDGYRFGQRRPSYLRLDDAPAATNPQKPESASILNLVQSRLRHVLKEVLKTVGRVRFVIEVNLDYRRQFVRTGGEEYLTCRTLHI